ncbi:MAG: tRNA epoxyqueuosine(34) reductase QueG [Gammaproteobacteria bacterium]|nr:tRNA epoxyqueuosine(34) reductase QueG [Gammaproteobacteria bacterium]
MPFDGASVQTPDLLGGIQSVCLFNHEQIITVKPPANTRRGSIENAHRAASLNATELSELAQRIKRWGAELGFQQLGIADTDLQEHEKRLGDWLAAGYHGEMDYMARHGTRRSRPGELLPGTRRVIAARMDYLSDQARPAGELFEETERALVSRYALGRDYHKVLRKRLQKLATRIEQAIGPFGYRVFVDSAPVLEKALAEKAGLGWIGKHSNLLNQKAGSWFFLGEIYTDLPLPVDTAGENHCGDCVRCIEACPTEAIVAPYRVDARRCISYLTIELKGSIPVELRPLMGNRIYGCDDCQMACPWNRFSRPSAEDDFRPRHDLDDVELVALFSWSEAQFMERTEGSAIRRTGYLGWLRNIAVALGNVDLEMSSDPGAVTSALASRRDHESALVREHVEWALNRLAQSDQTGF